MSDKRKKKKQDAAIDRAAEALWKYDLGVSPWIPSWDETDENDREEYRASVTVVVKAWLKAVKP